MTSNDELEREEFEYWAEEAGALPWGTLKKRRMGNGYSAQIYNYMWHAWQAALASKQEQSDGETDLSHQR